MNIKYNLKELDCLMRSFYDITGIRFILFDTDYKKIISYPENECAFCETMRKYSATSRKCAISDRKAFKVCKETEGPFLYKCHAGLVEASLALKVNDNVVGYLMFGQMTDKNINEENAKELIQYCSDYGIPETAVKDAILEIKQTDNDRLVAAARVLEACMSYIILKELITPENDRLFVDAKDFIEEHLQDPPEIYSICAHLNISRTKLYEIFKKESGIGVSEYIRKRRMHKAKKLLKNTKKTVSQIAQEVGFDDYTYFSRVFKTTYGKTPRDMRKD